MTGGIGGIVLFGSVSSMFTHPAPNTAISRSMQMMIGFFMVLFSCVSGISCLEGLSKSWMRQRI